ncbi:MAG: class I SAM-dependent methyltransferase [Bacillota bacterium]|nr:class I SAM-dependent methyltransferase [Bacillota bacterium]
MTAIRLQQITDLSHHFACPFLKAGDRVVDATAGNGKDTLFLAEKVGPSGLVYAFDIQKEALKGTEQVLKEAGLAGWVRCICDGHEKMIDYIEGPVNAVIYNLGYLPGGNHKVTTTRETTGKSLKQAFALLEPGGVVMIVLYPGHPAGKEEKEMLLSLCRSLDPAQFSSVHLHLLNKTGIPPELIAVQKNHLKREYFN